MITWYQAYAAVIIAVVASHLALVHAMSHNWYNDILYGFFGGAICGAIVIFICMWWNVR